MVNKLPSINLLKTKEESFLNKFIRWALTIGRLVVIITEGVALAAFIYRFSLDKQLVDLNDKIKSEQSIVKSFKNNEDKYRNLQERLALASKLSITGESSVKIFDDVFSFAPKDFIFSNFIMSEDRIKIDANVGSIPSLAAFISNIKNYPNITSVNLDKIENKVANATISVTIIANLKKNK